MNRKGVALIIIFSTILVLLVIGTTIVLRSVNEKIGAQRYIDSTQAFWLADAGINRAINELKSNYTSLYNISSTALGPGGYSVDIQHNALDDSRNVTAHGFIPFGSASYKSERIIRAVMIKNGTIPDGFYNNTIYTPGFIQGPSSNNAYINGSVRYGTSNGTDLAKVDISGNTTLDTNLTSLADLDFTRLAEISESQSNYHNSTQLGGPFPTSFWYNESAGIPNVVYMEGDFDLSGNTAVAGFFIVGGNLTYNATMSGKVSVDGCIYSRGSFTINGGGNVLNIDGGVWSGNVTLNGNTKLAFNQTYMSAINSLDINRILQLKSWQDEQNPYQLRN